MITNFLQRYLLRIFEPVVAHEQKLELSLKKGEKIKKKKTIDAASTDCMAVKSPGQSRGAAVGVFSSVLLCPQGQAALRSVNLALLLLTRLPSSLVWTFHFYA